ncbi:hypothetical protein GCM10010286_54000 [Streptomyces toxytricini]|nr:hypothetical protein GCM10010286_54000 [Streptomyces toxytricini]
MRGGRVEEQPLIGTSAFHTVGQQPLTGEQPAPPRHSHRLAPIHCHYPAHSQGSPHLWGATGPYRFGCSGLTLYSYKRAGKALPCTAAQQYSRTTHVAAGSRRPGDLVFFGRQRLPRGHLRRAAAGSCTPPIPVRRPAWNGSGPAA